MAALIEGLLFVAVGLVLLGNTLGYISWRVWLDAAAYWPVILIVIGVLVLLRRRVPGLLVFLLIVMIALNAISLPLQFAGNWPDYVFRPGSPPRPFPGDDRSGTVHVSQALEPGVSSLAVAMDLGTGNLELSGGTSNLIEGYLDYTGATPVVNYDRSGARATMSIKGEHAWGRRDGTRSSWRIGLNESVPVSLDIDAGAIIADMNLATVKLSALDVGMGAGQLKIRLGDNGLATDVTINTGASEVTVVVPSSVGMRVKTSSAFTEQNLGSAGFAKSDGHWVTPNYGSSKSTVEIRISSVLTKLRVERP
ncbi:MAG: hypothetical protein HPY55_00250 [Firmicutes bacterium]|nr:hypothetical protein [Bacillota bacterium]